MCTNQKLTQKMVFVIVQIRSGTTILETWYGCSIPEGSSLADVYTSFSSGQLDHGLLYLKSIKTLQLLSRLAKVEVIW